MGPHLLHLGGKLVKVSALSGVQVAAPLQCGQIVQQRRAAGQQLLAPARHPGPMRFGISTGSNSSGMPLQTTVQLPAWTGMMPVWTKHIDVRSSGRHLSAMLVSALPGDSAAKAASRRGSTTQFALSCTAGPTHESTQKYTDGCGLPLNVAPQSAQRSESMRASTVYMRREQPTLKSGA